MSFLTSAPMRYLGLMLGSWLTVFTLTRLALLAHHWESAQVDGLGFLGIILSGWVYDLAFLAYASLLPGLCLLLCPSKVWQRPSNHLVLQVFFAFIVYLMLFCALAEWLFWDEFGVRFNFIAVDYLVYSTEVLNNIQQSYPVYRLLASVALLSLVVISLLWRPLKRALEAPLASSRTRLTAMGALCVVSGISSLILGQDMPRGHEGNTYQRELASNGPYQFFAAFRNNELDYSQFYSSLPEQQLGKQLRAELAEANAQFTGTDPLDIRRQIDNPGPPNYRNIVLVTLESLSAKYLGSFGNTHKLTPNLDKLREQSWFFNNFYATGTRTDRGLEAITLSIPPTPGRSIVKRIGRESGFASLGQQLSSQGYDSVFLYGGRGYFDNMNAFFSGNGYRVIDQNTVPSEEIHFENAWGMADEDLYSQALKVADADHLKGQPFLLQLMTTSNHRPYSYPEGRIDIPSGAGREGAVKYTDWAIGQFLEQARQKPWFKDTLFVFVADHCAGSAGSEDLPIDNYHIPLFIYAPELLKPREDKQLASQIDLAPTLLGLLNVDYSSRFFGRDLSKPNTLPPRVLIGNYQHLGLFDGKTLAILSPQQGIRLRSATGESQASPEAALVQRNMAYYQSASHNYQHHLLNWFTPANQQPVVASSTLQ